MRLTASGLPRAVNCLFGFRDDVELLPDDPSPSAMIGTAVHAAIECYLCGLKPTKLEVNGTGLAPWMKLKATEMYHAWFEWWPQHNGNLDWRPEVKYCLSPDGIATVDGMKLTGPRQYHHMKGLAGTADAVHFSADIVTVIDWKTGHGLVQAATSEQLRFLGAVAAKAHGVPKARIVIGQITVDHVLWDEHVMDETECAHVLEDAMALMRMIPESEPNGGSHCKYCRAKSCEERVQA